MRRWWQWFPAVFLILVSLGVIIYSVTSLSFIDYGQPGPGIFPMLLGVLLLGLSVALLFSREEAAGSFWEFPGSWKRPLLAVALFSLFALAFERLGTIPCIFLFGLAWQCLLERKSLAYGLATGIGSAAVVWVLFIVLLKVPFPMGILAPR